MKKPAILICLLVLLVSLAACAGTAPAEDNAPEKAVVAVAQIADPAKAIEEIYKDIEMLGLETGIGSDLRDKFLIDTELLEDYDFKFTSGRFGVADVFILKPVADKAPQVRESLEKVKLNRAREFENYDIRNARQIALDASIFEQDGYVIMLMLDDVKAAREIIDKYIPKN